MQTKRSIQAPQRTSRLRRPEVAAVMRAAHVVPWGNGWMVVKAGPKRTRVTFPNKGAALSYAKSLACEPSVPIMVHGRDGLRSIRGKSPSSARHSATATKAGS